MPLFVPVLLLLFCFMITTLFINLYFLVSLFGAVKPADKPVAIGLSFTVSFILSVVCMCFIAYLAMVPVLLVFCGGFTGLSLSMLRDKKRRHPYDPLPGKTFSFNLYTKIVFRTLSYILGGVFASFCMFLLLSYTLKSLLQFLNF